MDNSILGLIVFVGSYIAARFVNERALRKLTESEAAGLLQGFSGYRIYSLVGVVSIVVIYFGLNAAYPGNRFTSLPVFVGVLVAFMLFSSVYAFRKLKSIKMPDAYVNSFLVTTFIQYIGIFAFFASLLGKAS